MDIAFDIETIANTSMVDRLPSVEVKTGNLKDPDKIAEKEAAARAEQVGKMALSPLYGRICAWVSINANGETYRECLSEECDDQETSLIESAFKRLSGHRIITYNGTGFDLPFIYRRAILLGVDPRNFGMPTLAEMLARYNNDLHLDIMQAWCGFGNYEKLDNLASALLGDHKNEIDFHEFPGMIKTVEGRGKLLDYCQQDVALTMRIWNRIAGILV